MADTRYPKMADPKYQKTAAQAQDLLKRIQAGGCRKLRLLGVPVGVRPLEGNAFEIVMDMSQDGAMDAARRLNDVGTDIRPWKPKATDTVRAVATWDTMLNYLAMTGDLR